MFIAYQVYINIYYFLKGTWRETFSALYITRLKVEYDQPVWTMLF